MTAQSILDFVEVVKRRNFVILDTETTGLRYPAEIIEIAVIDPDRKVLLNQRLRPRYAIPPEATAVHGITDADVEHALTWQLVRTALVPLLSGKDVIIYNASYDYGMLWNTDRVWELPHVAYDDLFTPHCAMLWYAQYYGEWNDYRQSYRWQKLTDACMQLGLPVENAHGALGDCLMTAKVIDAVIAELSDAGDL